MKKNRTAECLDRIIWYPREDAKVRIYKSLIRPILPADTWSDVKMRKLLETTEIKQVCNLTLIEDRYMKEEMNRISVS